MHNMIVDLAQIADKAPEVDDLRGFWSEDNDKACQVGLPMQTVDYSTLPLYQDIPPRG